MNWYDAMEEAYHKGYAKGQEDALKWIPVTERLPDTYLNSYVDYDGSECEYEVSEYVLVLTKFGECGIDRYENSDAFIGWVSTDDITHWMPLPEPPKVVE